MGRYRLYPDKGNTIIQNSNINTGLNEVFELWYGIDGIARHLIHFDFSGYYEKYLSGEVPHITATTAILHLEPCYPFFERNPYEDAHPANGSIIDVKIVQQYWESGSGYDFYGTKTINDKSNWYSASTITNWALPGGDFIYTVFSGIVSSLNSPINVTVSDEIELWNAFTGHNYGFVIKFNDDFEELSGDTKHILKYFSNNAHTKYKMPYIEFSWDNKVTDQRDSIYPDSTGRLYLYTKKNGTFANVYDISGVTITGDSISTFTSTTIHNPMRGVYYVDWSYPSTGATGVTFIDKWSVKFESGMSYALIEKSGVTSQLESEWSHSSEIQYPNYSVVIPNLMDSYTKGDMVYLKVNCYRPYTSTIEIVKNLEYRIDLIDGSTTFELTDWDDVSYTNEENFILLDTSWLHENYTYSIRVRYKLDGSLTSNPISKTFKII